MMPDDILNTSHHSNSLNKPRLTRKRERPANAVAIYNDTNSRRYRLADRPASPSNHGSGYKNPPKHTQFKPGQSGNQKGRPKKVKSQNVKTLVVDELMTPMTITENGKKVKLPAFQVSLRRLSVEAAKGSISAIRLHAKLAKEFMVSGHDEIKLTPEQELLLQEMLDDE